MQLKKQGFPNREIARQLIVSRDTTTPEEVVGIAAAFSARARHLFAN